MARIDPERWHVLSAYLDRAFDLADEAERAVWLAALREQDSALATEVEGLLQAHSALREEGFLESPAVPLPARAAAAGTRVGAYELVSVVGQGGMGTVWLAARSDGRFERRAAIKFLNVALTGGGEDRFRREGRIVARLSHSHIAQLLDAGVAETGQPYLVLEYVDGQPLDQYCDEHALDVPARLRLFLDVLDAIAHAHAMLIVHRDIKPSNVLVTRDGQVKLLDFGIAKLLDDEEHPGAATILTREVGTALTPAYAAPEQVTGQPVSAATDVYALGVLLYVLLTGQHPAGERLRSPADLVRAIVDTEPVRASEVVSRRRTDGFSVQATAARRAASPDKLRRLLRGDLDTIVAKALKKQPAERYVSVLALADDLRRYLKHEPISARPDSMTYRGAKFLRRHPIPVAAVALIVMALSVGLYAANRERVIAEQRFEQVRQLANKLFDIDIQVRRLPGSAQVRQFIVDTSLEYLRGLAAEVREDPRLALDVGTAYMRVARVQGVPISANLGQMDQADENLRTADALIDSVLAAQPGNRTAMFRKAQIAHDRMILAGLRRPADDALPLARRSAEWVQTYLDTGAVDTAETEQVLITLNNVGNRYRLEEQFEEALRLTARGLDMARAIDDPALQRQVGGLLWARAWIHRDLGALDEALQHLREAARLMEPAEGTTNQGQTLGFATVLIEQGAILANDDGVSLGRSDEAVISLRSAFEIIDEIVHQDPNDAFSRERVSGAGRLLANLLRHLDARQAQAIYDHVLGHLAEIQNNSRFRRDEVRALAASTYVLRSLGNPVEARRRLDAAFERLSQLNLYPAGEVNLGSEADDALRALAALEADTGSLERAREIARTLLDQVLASEPHPENTLAEAARLSRLFASLAVLDHRAGRADLASELDARRLQLWQHWERKLPNNPFVVGQLAAAGVEHEADVPLPQH